MSAIYFWTGTQVITVHKFVYVTTCAEYLGLYCVDLFDEEEDMTYGMFVKATSNKSEPSWKPVPYSDFPKDFKTWLLLMT